MSAKRMFRGTLAQVRTKIERGQIPPGPYHITDMARLLDRETYEGPNGERWKGTVASTLSRLNSEGLISRGQNRGVFIIPEKEEDGQKDKNKDLSVGDVLEVVGFFRDGSVMLRDEDGILMDADMYDWEKVREDQE